MNEDEIGEAAAWWHAAQETEDMDWPGFTTWLEADPRHRAAFDDITFIDEAVDRQRETLLRLRSSAEVMSTPSRTWPWRAAVAGVAAAIVAIVTVTFLPHQERTPATAPASEWSAMGTEREVRIADARITLAPGSKLTASSGGGERLALTGRAAFDVQHDPSHSLIVSAGGFEVRDVGTRFEVVAGSDVMQVSVVQGEVEVRSRAGGTLPVRVVAGRTATGTSDGRIVTSAYQGTVLAGWRTGPLVYDGTPLSLVAADLSRATGRKVVVDGPAADRLFSGVLAKGDAATMAANVAALAGLETRRQGETIRLGDRARR